MPSDTNKRRRSFLLHNNKRSASLILGVLLVFITIYVFFFHGDTSSLDCRIARPSLFDSSSAYNNNNNPSGNIIDAVQLLSSPSPRLQAHLQQVTFQNLNTAASEKETVMVAVMVVLPPWAIGPSLKTFFKQLAQQQSSLTHHTRLALLILNPTSPTTLYTVRHYLAASQLVDWPVDLYTKTYDALVPWVAQDDHHDDSNAIYELAPLRKSAMARAKNFLLQSALDPLDDYVLWLDPLLAEFPTTMIQDFLVAVQSGDGVDILVPNTMIRKDGAEWGYDRANWQETTMSKSLQDTVPEDFVFMEGWWEYDTHRFLMVDMLSNDDGVDGRTREFTKVPLDGVGSTCLFIKADIHRILNFPAYPYQHQLDSEALAKAAKLEGYTIMGLPNYKIYHANMGQEDANGSDGGGGGGINDSNDDSVDNDEGEDDDNEDEDDDDDTVL